VDATSRRCGEASEAERTGWSSLLKVFGELTTPSAAYAADTPPHEEGIGRDDFSVSA
jgi:hypothetical protein